MNKFENHISLTACSDVYEICRPLYNLGTTFFGYYRAYPDKTYILLSNNSKWNVHHLVNFHNRKYKDHHTFQKTIKQNLLLSLELCPYEPTFKDAADLFGLRYGFLLTFENEQYKELCYFGTNRNEPTICNYYLNNIDSLYQFKNYFKDQAKPLITRADKTKLVLSQKIVTKNINRYVPYNNLKNQFINEITINSRKILPFDPKGRYLTAKEFECISWYVRGKTAEEIGLISGLSNRTVEKYLENLKNKFDCIKISQLIYKLARFGLII